MRGFNGTMLIAAGRMADNPPGMHSLRNVTGGKFRTPIFMIGQLMPRHSLRRIKKIRSLRDGEAMPER
ncbi:MAG: hypothetical protein JWQ21_2649 [Herminiimonas sp.]|nr:hypothetical protein [Herminiimonas sp.]